MKSQSPTMLIVLDGFGYYKNTEHNAIAAARVPHLHTWLASSSCRLLRASGTAVGLPDGYIGNSQVGHLTLASGRIIEQPLTILNHSTQNHSLARNEILCKNLKKLAQTHNRLHIIGLLSDSGVHSHIDHLFAFIKIAHEMGIKNIIVHPFLDGRDVPPTSAATYLQKLDSFLASISGSSIGTIHGRWYAMDRDNHWERTQKSYDVLTTPTTPIYKNWQELLKASYAENITDEFIIPTALKPDSEIRPEDGVIFCNIRPDRARQLTAAFCDPHFSHFPVKKLSLCFFITPFSLGSHIQTTVLFQQPEIHNTLKEILSKAGKTIFSIAETEKYAHVTYFFDGGKETMWPTEQRVLIPSLPGKTYADHPCMSAPEITAAVIKSLQSNPCDFYLINYANADMVGHSGNFQATVKAVECLDKQLQQLYDIVIKQMQGVIYIVGDHGKAEDMYDEKNKSPRTAHTTHPVPFIILGDPKHACTQFNQPTQLADVAPLILCQIGLQIPPEMIQLKK